jgi:selenocysteine lyase/cysteine desulfurase
MTMDVEWVRGQFPAFAEPDLAGWAFFENAGGSYPCRAVVERLGRFYRSRKVQPYAPYPVSELAGAEMDEARERLAVMLGVATDELSFGPSTTQNTYVLAQAVRRWIRPGQAIVVTNQDHEANSGPWNGGSIRGREALTPTTCAGCLAAGMWRWCAFRIVPTWWPRSTMSRRSPRWRMRRGRGSAWTG